MVLGSRFWRLFSAVSVSNVADGVSIAALPLLAASLTDDARLISLVAVARFVPWPLFALPAGQLLDRYDRRALVLGSQVVRAAIMLALAVSVTADRASVGLLITTAFLIGTGETVSDTGTTAMVRQVVRREALEVANARLSSSEIVGNYFVGPPLGGLLFGWSADAAFYVDAAGFFAAALALAALPGPFRAAADEEAGIDRSGRLTAGLRWLWRHDVLRPLALSVAAIAFLSNAMNGVAVILALERYGLSELGFGVLLSIEAIAALAASVATPWVIRRIGHTGSMAVACVAFSAGALLYGVGTAVAVAVVAAVVGGLGDPLWNVVSQTIRHRLVPDEIFGRVLGAYLFIAWSTQPLGALAGGIVAHAFGVEVVYLATGVLMVPVALLLVRPMLRAAAAALAAQVEA